MVTTRLVPLLTVVIALLGLVGCWNDREQVDQAVWSDDDTAQAYTQLFFEEGPRVNPLSMTHPRRDYRHQLFVQRPDGSERRALTGVRAHRTGGNLYYMRAAGYVIVDVIADSGETRYDLVRLADGQVSTLLSHTPSGAPCASLDVVPSRDGLTIAVIERTTGPESAGRCPSGDAVVTLVDASTLSTLSSFRWALSDMLQSKWTEGGDLVVWTTADGAWRVDPADGPSPAETPQCPFPRTSSGSLSADGVLIGGGLSPDDPVTVFPPPPPGGDPYDCS